MAASHIEVHAPKLICCKSACLIVMSRSDETIRAIRGQDLFQCWHIDELWWERDSL